MAAPRKQARQSSKAMPAMDATVQIQAGKNRKQKAEDAGNALTVCSQQTTKAYAHIAGNYYPGNNRNHPAGYGITRDDNDDDNNLVR